MGLPIIGWAAMYEEANRSIFGPAALNCAAPDDGNINLLSKIGTEAQKDWFLQPLIEGKVRSSFRRAHGRARRWECHVPRHGRRRAWEGAAARWKMKDKRIIPYRILIIFT